MATKLKKPEMVPMYRTTAGAAVETIEQWKNEEIKALLVQAPSGISTDETAVKSVTDYLLDNADTFVAILGIIEKGRPLGAKDKAPRKRPAKPAAESAPTLAPTE